MPILEIKPTPQRTQKKATVEKVVILETEPLIETPPDNFQEDFLKELNTNAMLWGMLFCRHHFRIPSPRFHLDILQETEHNKFVAIASPRESSKSTLIAFNKVAHSICFKKKRFILIVSNTHKKACGSLDSVKKEIKENEKIRTTFQIEVIKDAEGDSVFRHKDGFETRILCKGAEQIGAVRGEKFGAYRPDLIIVDDVEDDEMVKNPERRQSLRELYDEALVPAGEKGLVEIIVIGTVLHDDSLLARLVSERYYPEYRKMIFKALRMDKTGELISLWKEKWSVQDLQKLEKEKPVVFAKEYQNDPVSGSVQRFHLDDFRYWKIENLNYVLFDAEGGVVARGKLSECKAAIACDLAWEEKKESDFAVIMPAFLTPQSDILVENYIWKQGLRPNEIEEILFSMEERLRSLTGTPVPIGFEKAMYEKVAKWLLLQTQRKRNHFLWLKDLVWDSDKITRIETRLQPRYAQKTIYHKQGMGDLEHQLLRFPSATHDDLADALQGLCQLLTYPKIGKTPEIEDDKFARLRNFAIMSKHHRLNLHRDPFVFGKKTKTVKIPAQISVLG